MTQFCGTTQQGLARGLRDRALIHGGNGASALSRAAVIAVSSHASVRPSNRQPEVGAPRYSRAAEGKMMVNLRVALLSSPLPLLSPFQKTLGASEKRD